MPQKKSHHLWTAETDKEGQVVVKRSEKERDEFNPQEFCKAVIASGWGIYGASIYDEIENLDVIPEGVRNRFAVVASEMKKSASASPVLKTWQGLGEEYGVDKIAEIRQHVGQGMKVRSASKDLGIPFVLAADIIDDMEIIGKKAMKGIVDMVKAGNVNLAVKSYGKPAENLVNCINSGIPKLAVDEAAKDYWTEYYGEFGEQLVKDVKKRIKADVAYNWMIKNGVDEAAAEYWQSYFSEEDYGKLLTETLPKKLSPSDKKKDK